MPPTASFLVSRCFQAAMKMKKMLVARKSTFQLELVKIVSSSSKELQVWCRRKCHTRTIYFNRMRSLNRNYYLNEIIDEVLLLAAAQAASSSLQTPLTGVLPVRIAPLSSSPTQAGLQHWMWWFHWAQQLLFLQPVLLAAWAFAFQNSDLSRQFRQSFFFAFVPFLKLLEVLSLFLDLTHLWFELMFLLIKSVDYFLRHFTYLIHF